MVQRTRRRLAVQDLFVRVTNMQQQERVVVAWLVTVKDLWGKRKRKGWQNEKSGLVGCCPRPLLLLSSKRYAMTIIDVIYVRSSYRRRGLAMLMLNDIVALYPNEYIGFTIPISVNLQAGESFQIRKLFVTPSNQG